MYGGMWFTLPFAVEYGTTMYRLRVKSGLNAEFTTGQVLPHLLGSGKTEVGARPLILFRFMVPRSLQPNRFWPLAGMQTLPLFGPEVTVLQKATRHLAEW